MGAALGAVSGVYRPSCAGAAVLSDGGGGRDAAGGDLSGAVPADAGRQEKQPPADLITGDAAVFCLDADYQRCGADYLRAVCSAGFTADQSNTAAGMGGDPANDCRQHRQYADAGGQSAESVPEQLLRDGCAKLLCRDDSGGGAELLPAGNLLPVGKKQTDRGAL